MGSLGPRKTNALMQLLTSMTRSLSANVMEGPDGSMVQAPMLVFDPITSKSAMAVEWRKKMNLNSIEPPLQISIDAPSTSATLGPPAAGPTSLSKVYVEAFIASRLRAHQQEGVKFMIECLLGIRDP